MTTHKQPSSSLHIRNKHKDGYNLKKLANSNPKLKEYIFINDWQKETIDFANPEAVFELNKGILFSDYKIKHWELNKNSLCPAIPGRVDYIHHIADLISEGAAKTKTGSKVKILDIGTGSSLIYPILGAQEYEWDFIATEIDKNSIYHAEMNINKNAWLKKKIQLRFQDNSEHILKGILFKEDKFDAIICNPPFFKSREDNWKSSTKKFQNLSKNKETPTVQNFAGHPNELWCPGGEKAFITKLIYESKEFKNQLNWITSLVSSKESLKPLVAVLEYHKAAEIKIIEMKHGQKATRILAWKW